MSTLSLVIGISCLVLAAIHDARTGFIPDRLSIGACFVIVCLAGVGGTLPQTLLAAVGTAAPMLLLYALTRGRGLGFGDVKLAALIGAVLGLSLGYIALGLAFVVGAAICIIGLWLRRMHRGQEIAFAPYLAIGSLIALFARGVQLV